MKYFGNLLVKLLYIGEYLDNIFMHTFKRNPPALVLVHDVRNLLYYE